MKVFISWSGERSRRVAEYLRDWLKMVIQSSDPWVSSKDIENGSWWFSTIGEQLAVSAVGILCITNENKDKPWIMFEAGAISKGQIRNRAMPFLIDIDKSEIKPPLTQLHLTSPTQEEMMQLLKTINNQNEPESKLDERVLSSTFDVLWPKFLENFERIIEETPYADQISTPPRKAEDILEEVLTSVRSLENKSNYFETDVINSFEIFNLNSRFYKAVEESVDLNVTYGTNRQNFIDRAGTFEGLITIFYEGIPYPFRLPEDVTRVVIRDVLLKRGLDKYFVSASTLL